MPACKSNRCSSGRVECPTPQACEISDSDLAPAEGLVLSVMISLLVWCIVAMALLAFTA